MIDHASPSFLPARHTWKATERWLKRNGYHKPDWPLRLAIMMRLLGASGETAVLVGREIVEVRDWLGSPPTRYWPRKAQTHRRARRRAMRHR